MKKLTIRETRQSLTRLDRLLAEEGEITVTRRGGPIARIIQIDRIKPIPSHQDLRKLTPKIKEGSEKLIRKDRDAR
jgi:antitoxin (DNA-binding transcriptional repressor) of toxin-antitoxin stability system